MDVVIPLGTGSRQQNLELKYCLRGIEKFLPQRENIFLVGECPAWVQGVVHVPHDEKQGRQFKSRNIYSKLMAVCGDKRVSDPFYFFNDDHFLLREYDGAYHFRGILSDALRNCSIHNDYRFTISNTIGAVGDVKDFDMHCPIVYEKDLFVRSLGTLKWNVSHGYAIKSVYCAMNGIKGELFPDIKAKRHLNRDQILSMVEGRPYFTTGDVVSVFMIRAWEILYPDKCIYEK